MIAIEVAILACIATFFLPDDGGGDLRVYYQPVARGNVETGYVPYFAYWFLWPLGLMPHALAHFVLTAFGLAVVLAITYSRRTNPLIVMASFPAMVQIWTGQIDALVMLGLALTCGLFGQQSWRRGVGLILALIKPQISLLAIAVWGWQSPRAFLKLLPIPIIGALLSFAQFGLFWPIEWLTQAQGLPTHEYRVTVQLLFPYSLIVLIVPFLLKNPDKQGQAALVAAALLPQTSIYSYLVFVTFLKPMPWWLVPLSFIWMPFYPWLGADSHVVEAFFPISMLVYVSWGDVKWRF